MEIQVYKRKLFWRVKLIGKNGEAVLTSEAYYSKANAERSASRLGQAIAAVYRKK